MYAFEYSQKIMPEKQNESVTHNAVHLLASLALIICGVLLKTPKSKARKIKIIIKKAIQTSIIITNWCVTQI
jgi:Na+/pantothenate symporter